jgi:hypothetical protein
MGKAVAKSKKGAWRKLDAADAEVDMPPGANAGTAAATPRSPAYFS